MVSNSFIECFEAAGLWHSGTAYIGDGVWLKASLFFYGKADLFHSNDLSEFLAKLPVLDPVAERFVSLSILFFALYTESGPS